MDKMNIVVSIKKGEPLSKFFRTDVVRAVLFSMVCFFYEVYYSTKNEDSYELYFSYPNQRKLNLSYSLKALVDYIFDEVKIKDVEFMSIRSDDFTKITKTGAFKAFSIYLDIYQKKRVNHYTDLETLFMMTTGLHTCDDNQEEQKYNFKFSVSFIFYIRYILSYFQNKLYNYFEFMNGCLEVTAEKLNSIEVYDFYIDVITRDVPGNDVNFNIENVIKAIQENPFIIYYILKRLSNELGVIDLTSDFILRYTFNRLRGFLHKNLKLSEEHGDYVFLDYVLEVSEKRLSEENHKKLGGL